MRKGQSNRLCRHRRQLGILASAQCYDYVTTGEKVMNFGFKVLDIKGLQTLQIVLLFSQAH